MNEPVDWWSAPPLDAADRRLADAYLATGKQLDDLPYTDDFDKLCVRLGVELTNDARHQVYRRLLTLRKMGRLPRLSMVGR